MIELAFKLHSPITDEEWDLLNDVDFDHTPRMMFHTKHGKDVEYVKVVRCKDCKHLNKEEMRCFEVEGLGYRNVVDEDFCSRGVRMDGEENG